VARNVLCCLAELTQHGARIIVAFFSNAMLQMTAGGLKINENADSNAYKPGEKMEFNSSHIEQIQNRLQHLL
jgi:hypothetical protein